MLITSKYVNFTTFQKVYYPPRLKYLSAIQFRNIELLCLKSVYEWRGRPVITTASDLVSVGKRDACFLYQMRNSQWFATSGKHTECGVSTFRAAEPQIQCEPACLPYFRKKDKGQRRGANRQQRFPLPSVRQPRRRREGVSLNESAKALDTANNVPPAITKRLWAETSPWACSSNWRTSYKDSVVASVERTTYTSHWWPSSQKWEPGAKKAFDTSDHIKEIKRSGKVWQHHKLERKGNI